MAINEIYSQNIPAIRADLNALVERVKSPGFAKLARTSLSWDEYITSPFIVCVTEYARFFEKGGAVDKLFDKLTYFVEGERKIVLEAKDYEATESSLRVLSAAMIALSNSVVKELRKLDRTFSALNQTAVNNLEDWQIPFKVSRRKEKEELRRLTIGKMEDALAVAGKIAVVGGKIIVVTPVIAVLALIHAVLPGLGLDVIFAATTTEIEARRREAETRR